VKRLAVVVLGAFVASLLVLLPSSNVGADEHDEFVINPTSGVPGDLVATAVDPEAVERECYTTPEEVAGAFEDNLAAAGEAIADMDLEGLEVAAAGFLQQLFGGLATPAQAAGLLDELFVLTFVDIATQEPVGEMSNWDPTTGEGEIAVPDLDPGLWAIAAVCLEPDFSSESLLAAIQAGAAYLEENATVIPNIAECITGFDGPIPVFDPECFAAYVAAVTEIIEELAPVFLAEMLQPRHTWTAPFTVLGAPVVPSPENEVFCAVLPALQPLGAEITEALANLPEDDGEMSQEEWEELADWEAIGAELRELFAEAQELLAQGDVARADEVADEWETVTEGLRAALNALEAVDYDLSTESGRVIAGQLREGARDPSPDPEGEAATEALTQWFFDNCVPAGETPPAETPVPETPRAAPAPAAQAQPTFTG
jgi:hypothetical protein